MTSILQSYNELLKDPSKWKYYSRAAVGPCSFDDFIMPTNRTLEEMLSAGEKLTSVISDVISVLSKERYSHILSTYIMGLCVYDKSTYVRNYLDSFVGELNLNKDARYRQFMYIWLLLCFFHDIGYAIEENRCNVDLNLYSNPPEDFIDAKLPDGFSNDLFDRYEEYRHNCMKKKDHGIWSGRILYKEVEDLRKRRFQKVQKCLQSETCHCNGLCCRKDLSLIYSKVARTIMAHNIYYADDSSIKCYKCMHLDELITRKKRNIDIQKHPLLFFFDLIDTMEPIKRPNLASALSKIKWHISEKSISFDLEEMDCSQRNLYTRQLIGMNTWLTSVRIDQDHCNKIRVKIKN